MCADIVQRIMNTFKYHKPFGDQAKRYEELREGGKVLALLIAKNCPDSRERSKALTQVQSAVMFANAAIACNENEPLVEGPKETENENKG